MQANAIFQEKIMKKLCNVLKNLNSLEDMLNAARY